MPALGGGGRSGHQGLPAPLAGEDGGDGRGEEAHALAELAERRRGAGEVAGEPHRLQAGRGFGGALGAEDADRSLEGVGGDAEEGGVLGGGGAGDLWADGE